MRLMFSCTGTFHNKFGKLRRKFFTRDSYNNSGYTCSVTRVVIHYVSSCSQIDKSLLECLISTAI